MHELHYIHILLRKIVTDRQIDRLTLSRIELLLQLKINLTNYQTFKIK